MRLLSRALRVRFASRVVTLVGIHSQQNCTRACSCGRIYPSHTSEAQKSVAFQSKYKRRTGSCLSTSFAHSLLFLARVRCTTRPPARGRNCSRPAGQKNKQSARLDMNEWFVTHKQLERASLSSNVLFKCHLFSSSSRDMIARLVSGGRRSARRCPAGAGDARDRAALASSHATLLRELQPPVAQRAPVIAPKPGLPTPQALLLPFFSIVYLRAFCYYLDQNG